MPRAAVPGGVQASLRRPGAGVPARSRSNPGREAEDAVAGGLWVGLVQSGDGLTRAESVPSREGPRAAPAALPGVPPGDVRPDGHAPLARALRRKCAAAVPCLHSAACASACARRLCTRVGSQVFCPWGCGTGARVRVHTRGPWVLLAWGGLARGLWSLPAGSQPPAFAVPPRGVAAPEGRRGVRAGRVRA